MSNFSYNILFKKKFQEKGGFFMYNFNKKQKIILGILTAVVAGVICYYVYAKQEETDIEQINSENNIQIRKYWRRKI